MPRFVPIHPVDGDVFHRISESEVSRIHPLGTINVSQCGLSGGPTDRHCDWFGHFTNTALLYMHIPDFKSNLKRLSGNRLE